MLDFNHCPESVVVVRYFLSIQFEIDLYFALVEKMMVFDGGRVVVGLLDGTSLECEI